jgi:hypothetical protein
MLEFTEEKISDHEDMAIETIQNETEKSENVLNKYEIHSEM